MASKKTGGALVKWDEELAKQAALAAGMEDSTATGQFFSLKSGQLSYNDAPMPNNEMAVVILDAILENVYFEGEYDPDHVQAPTCFAFGRSEQEMRPHQSVVDAGQAVSDACKGCPYNEFGSADKGRGKACRNTRRLAMIPGGTLDDRGRFTPFKDAEHFDTAQIAYMKLPVTSVRGYAGFVKQLAGALKRPPHAVFTKVKVVPDASSQFKVTFEPISQIPDNLLGSIMKRHEEAMAAIEFPYQLDDGSGQEKSAGKRKSAAKKGTRPVVKRGRY